MMMTTIGAAIIAKNEANNIARCIASVRPFCEQIVVVDTGSGDNTATIAAKFGVDIYFCKWDNNFANARNFAKQHIYSDWILSIDADEELVANSFNTNILNEISDNIGGFSVEINNFLDIDLLNSKKHRFTRLFKNIPQIQWKGRIHEQIAESIYDANLKISDSNIVLNHYGYIGKNPPKEERNIELLKDEINSNPNDDFFVYHLANSYFAQGDTNRAYDTYKGIINSMQLSLIQQQEVKIKMAQIALAKDDYNSVIQHLNFIADDIDTEGLRLSILGSAYLQMKNFSKAKETLTNPAVEQSTLVSQIIIQNAKKIFQYIGM